MPTPPGYLFEVPEALLKGGLYIPLETQVVMPGGAAMVQSTSEESALLFEHLASRDEIFAAVYSRHSTLHEDGAPDFEQIGTLGLVADHRKQAPGRWVTIIAGIGRVRLGSPYMIDPNGLPRVDAEVIETTCEDTDEAQRRLGQFSAIAASLGSTHPDLVKALHRYATNVEQPSLSVDRLAGLIGVTSPDWLQQILSEPDVLARLNLLDAQLLDYIARVTGADMSRATDKEIN